MNSAEQPAPSAPPVWNTQLRVVARVVLALGASFLVDLGALALLPHSASFVTRLLQNGLPKVPGSLGPAAALLAFTVLACALLGWRLWAQRSRSLIYAGLMLAAVLAADLAVLSRFYADIVDPLAAYLSFNPLTDLGYLFGLVVVLPVMVTTVVWRLRSWPRIAAGYVVIVSLLAYLAVDDPRLVAPASLEQLSPGFPEAEASFNVLMRYGRYHPLGKGFKAPDRIFTGTDRFVDVSKPAEWTAWLPRHREAVEADWADLAPVRAWIEELNRFDRIGDLTLARLDAEIISYSPLRAYAHHTCAIAGLQALAGRGDDAIATLLPLLEVSRKLEPSSRTLVRTMIACVMQKEAISTARLVLDTTPVSPAMRSRLAAALTLGIGGEAGVRRLLAIECTFTMEMADAKGVGEIFFSQRRLSPMRPILHLVEPFLYNHRHTANLYAAHTAELQALAARRDMAAFARAQSAYLADKAAPGFKNYLGKCLLGLVMPSYGKVVETYWSVDDARTTLLAQLTKP